MLVSQKIVDAINGQIGMEFAASLQYDAIGAYFDLQSLPTLAKHFYKQSTEERGHAHRFMSFVLDAGNSRGGLERYPNLVRAREAIQARPAWQRALERGGEYKMGA